MNRSTMVPFLTILVCSSLQAAEDFPIPEGSESARSHSSSSRFSLLPSPLPLPGTNQDLLPLAGFPFPPALGITRHSSAPENSNLPDLSTLPLPSTPLLENVNFLELFNENTLKMRAQLALLKKEACIIPAPFTAKTIIASGAAGATLTIGAVTLLKEASNRGLVRDLLLGSSAEIGIGTCLGALATTLAVKIWMGNKLNTISQMSGTITNLAKQLTEVQKIINEHKQNKEDFESKLTDLTTLYERTVEAQAGTTKTSEDIVKLSETQILVIQEAQKNKDELQRFAAELEHQRLLIRQVIDALPEDKKSGLDADVLKTITELQRENAAIKAYNKHFKVTRWHRVHDISKIPAQWLQDNGYSDLVTTTDGASSI